jgi:hypothetical protein
MGFRFHKSIPLLPFLRLNLSKSGVSFSLGAPGTSLNVGPKGTRGSVGIPGTGLSYRKTLIGKGKSDAQGGRAGSNAGGVILNLILLGLLYFLGVYVYSILQK